MDSTDSPWVEIVEQPAARGLRFQPLEGGRSAKRITGANSTSGKKTFPTIQVHGFKGSQFIVVVSCVAENEPYRPHPNHLEGVSCKKGVCSMRVCNKLAVAFPDLYIDKARKRDFESRMKMRRQINVDPYQTGFRYNPSEIDLRAVRLCFQVFLPDDKGKITRIIPPVVSQPIYDRRYHDNDSPRYLKKHLYQQVEEQSELCDVTIQVGGWTRKYHWCVLCVIPFFSKLYASRMKEQRTGIISLSIGSPTSVQNALDFLYGKEPDVQLNTVFKLMETADFLMIDELKKKCMKKVKSFPVSMKTCLPLMFICSRFDIYIPKLEQFYLSHLPELMKQDQMLEIDKEAVRYILNNKSLSYVSREDIFEFLLKWCEYSSERKFEVREFLSCFKPDDIPPEVLKTITDSRPDLLEMIQEIFQEVNPITDTAHEPVHKTETSSDVLVFYPPPQKLFEVIFYVFSFKADSWYRVPVRSEESLLLRSHENVTVGKDKLFLVNNQNDTLSVYNFLSGQSSEKKLKFLDAVYVDPVHATFAVSGQKLYFIKNSRNIVVNTDVKNSAWNEGPADLLVYQMTTKVYVSQDLDTQEIKMHPLFSIDSQIDDICVAGDHLCLHSLKTQQLIVYCLERHLRTYIDLSPYGIIGGRKTLSFSDKHVYILAEHHVIDVQFRTSPKKIIWDIHKLYPNECMYPMSTCDLIQDKIVKRETSDKRQRKLKWQSLGDTKGKSCVIDLPEKLSSSTRYQVLQLQLPKQTLKCHIDCPHCKQQEEEQFDIFTYQQTFSSDDESASQGSERWTDYESDSS